MRRHHLAAVAVGVLAPFATSACSDPVRPSAAGIEAVGGDSQVGIVGQTLPKPLRARVFNLHGAGVPDVEVTWEALYNTHPTFRTHTTTTDSAGVAQIVLRLGTIAGDVRISARVPTASVEFTEHGEPGPLARLRFLPWSPPCWNCYDPPPVSAAMGEVLLPPVVWLTDAEGNLRDTDTSRITVFLTPGDGTPGAVLGGALTRSASAGVARFDDLTVDKLGVGYSLSATTPGVPGTAVSASFDITNGPATALEFVVQPSAVRAGSWIRPAVQVRAKDRFGNTAGSGTYAFGYCIWVLITRGTGTGGALLRGKPMVCPVSGIATFDSLAIDEAGVGYTLTATAPGVSPATSSPFVVSPASPSGRGPTPKVR